MSFRTNLSGVLLEKRRRIYFSKISDFEDKTLKIPGVEVDRRETKEFIFVKVEDPTFEVVREFDKIPTYIWISELKVWSLFLGDVNMGDVNMEEQYVPEKEKSEFGDL